MSAVPLYVVVYMVGGWSRDCSDTAEVAGVYTDEDLAKKVAIACRGEVRTVDLNKIKPGHLGMLQALGFDVSPNFDDTEIQGFE